MRRKMGMLFQFGALFTDLSVFENVAFPLREHTDLPDELIRDLVLLKLQAVGLRGAAHLMPSELSGGMARRVALARAIALDPLLILYDEPFTGLDPISLGVIVRLIRELNDALGATSIIVTHDVQEALDVVDYVYFMADGARHRAGHAGRDPRAAPSRSCTSSSTASPTARCRSTTRRPTTPPTSKWLRLDRHRVAAQPPASASAARVTAQVWRLGFASRFLALPAAALGHRAAPLPPDDRARSTSPACCR